jgi:undecaprenyl diphosphate synthase
VEYIAFFCYFPLCNNVFFLFENGGQFEMELVAVLHWNLHLGKNKRKSKKSIKDYLYSNDVSQVDLIIRWGGRRRLSGFLPVQSIYADFYVIEEYWPDFKREHFYEALKWYDKQDITYGG